MNQPLIRSSSLNDFFEKSANFQNQFLPENLHHFYLKLQIDPQYEEAVTKSDARRCLKSIAQATEATALVAGKYSGKVLEVQGSLIHVALPASAAKQDFCSDLHLVLRGVFSNPDKRVKAWRIVSDTGMTLLVTSPSLHGHPSTVSLGNAANQPAKYLIKQISLSMDDQSLKQFCYHDRKVSRTVNLDECLRSRKLQEEHVIKSSSIENQRELIEAIRSKSYDIEMRDVLRKQAKELPVEGIDPDEPLVTWGWVMRADLDGFTKRVSDCHENPQAMHDLAEAFVALMEDAAAFMERHKQDLIQLPWAGDNLTAVVSYESKALCDKHMKENLIGFSRDLESDLRSGVQRVGCSGWSQCVAAGEVHGNAEGNVTVATVTIEDREFLIGVGKGMGQSLRAMSEISPDLNEIVILDEDIDKLHPDLAAVFVPSTKADGSTKSTLFKTAILEELSNELDKIEGSSSVVPIVTAPSVITAVSTRPFAW